MKMSTIYCSVAAGGFIAVGQASVPGSDWRVYCAVVICSIILAIGTNLARIEGFGPPEHIEESDDRRGS